jgi:hypothetical protein
VTQFAPLPVWYVPAPQPTQPALPATMEYAPFGQLVHAVAPLAEYVPTTQSAHAADNFAPVAAANLPAGHRVQAAAPAATW